ncbi:Internalin-A_precursor [Hexamita inflata]|uniref:Internalin-A n=1 Tax=Hexamita inflata TaxID=28002 RepID=A0AA86P7I6_9EUKA|nr:Internalin-A precursor [Hexamita inflata]
MKKFNKLEIVSDDYIQSVNLCESQNIDAIILKRCMNVRFNRVNYNITALVVKSCNLQCIYGIEQMQQLKFLNLGDNRLTDISPLEGLSNLEYLNLEDNQVTDISPISDLNNLVILILKFKKLNPTDDRASINFELMPANLNVLVIKWYYLKSLQGIHKLQKLQYLNLSFNQLRDIKQLQCLVSLNTLNLSNNDLVFIEPLLNLKKLNIINISYNSIPQSQITQLQQERKINQLKHNYNQLVTDSQKQLIQFDTIYLQNVKIITKSNQQLIKTKINRTQFKQFKQVDYKLKVQQAITNCFNQQNYIYSCIIYLFNNLQNDVSQ